MLQLKQMTFLNKIFVCVNVTVTMIKKRECAMKLNKLIEERKRR